MAEDNQDPREQARMRVLFGCAAVIAGARIEGFSASETHAIFKGAMRELEASRGEAKEIADKVLAEALARASGRPGATINLGSGHPSGPGRGRARLWGKQR